MWCLLPRMEFTFEVEKVLPGVISILETNVDDSSIKIFPLDIEPRQDEKQVTSSWIYHASANIIWDPKLKRYFFIYI